MEKITVVTDEIVTEASKNTKSVMIGVGLLKVKHYKVKKTKEGWRTRRGLLRSAKTFTSGNHRFYIFSTEPVE